MRKPKARKSGYWWSLLPWFLAAPRLRGRLGGPADDGMLGEMPGGAKQDIGAKVAARLAKALGVPVTEVLG